MTEPPLADDAPRSLITWRALLAGSVGVVVVCVGIIYAEYVLVSASLGHDSSVPAAVFLMFVMALAVNLARAVTRRSLLNRSEMLVAYSMMAIGGAIATMGLVGYFLPLIATPHYFARPENRWRELLLPHMPGWLMLSPEGSGRMAINYLFEGLPEGADRRVVWEIAKVWARPLAYWGAFLLPLYATSVALMAIFRKQWVEGERIAFPLAHLPMELASEPSASGGRVSPFLKNPLLWLGFAVPFTFTSLRALADLMPFLEALEPGEAWFFLFLDEHWRVDVLLSWQTIGLAYLLGTDVSLCVWLFGFLGSFYHGASSLTGFASPQRLGVYGAARWPDLGHFGMGAMIALVFLRMWVARRHLAGVVRKGLGLKTDLDDRHEPMSYRAAFWIALVGFVAMAVWLTASGFSLPIALFILFAAFVGFVGLTRIFAECGMPVSIVPLVSSDFVVSAVGTSAIGREGLAAIPWTYAWNGDVRVFVMVSAAHGMRVCSERRRNYRGLFATMMFAVVLAVAVSASYTLFLAYQDGGLNLRPRWFGGAPQMPFNIARRWVETLDDPTSPALGPNLRGWTATGIGAAAMVLFTIARHQFVWWPLNPVGLPISVVTFSRFLWFSVFLAWLIKTKVVKYGGPKLYLKLRPFFLGLVLGHYSGAACWSIFLWLADLRVDRLFHY